jgi:predicted transcriptional regulator YheO
VFSRTKKVKATTTPIYDDRYGLVGIHCINIDVEAIERLDSKARDEFFENYVRNSGLTPHFELDQSDDGLAATA